MSSLHDVTRCSKEPLQGTDYIYPHLTLSDLSSTPAVRDTTARTQILPPFSGGLSFRLLGPHPSVVCPSLSGPRPRSSGPLTHSIPGTLSEVTSGLLVTRGDSRPHSHSLSPLSKSSVGSCDRTRLVLLWMTHVLCPLSFPRWAEAERGRESQRKSGWLAPARDQRYTGSTAQERLINSVTHGHGVGKRREPWIQSPALPRPGLSFASQVTSREGSA